MADELSAVPLLNIQINNRKVHVVINDVITILYIVAAAGKNGSQ